MRRAIVVFAVMGGILVPIAFTVAGWGLRAIGVEEAVGMALLRDIRLPLWPMSKLIDDDPSGRHWLYLPLAAVLSNALIYAAIGALSEWGRKRTAAFVAAAIVTFALLFAAQRGFGTGATGLAIAVAIVLTGLALHHRQRRPESSS
jgi:hypothetical protein